MELVSACSPGMEAAHKHLYVHTIVDILLKDRNLLIPTAMFLKQYSMYEQQGFKERLEALGLFRNRPDANGVVVPDHISTLTQTLLKLYQQRDKAKINYQRGAIVEALVRKLVSHRYNRPSEVCLNNQRFVENHRHITIQEVDVAALSNARQKAEGYECKINSAGLEAYDQINLSDLVNAAEERHYRVNAGFVAFENDRIMKFKLAKLQLPDSIKLYGLDSLESLEQLPFLDN